MTQLRYRRVNFIGGPGVGKSTAAKDLAAHMSKQGIKTEYVHEFVKQWAYQKREIKGFDQTFLFANQLHAEDSLLHDNNDLILVSDSPVLMNAWYGVKDNRPAWEHTVEIAHEFEKHYPSINIILQRCEHHRYDKTGRYQTLEEAKRIDAELFAFFNKANLDGNISLLVVVNADDEPEDIFKRIYGYLFPPEPSRVMGAYSSSSYMPLIPDPYRGQQCSIIGGFNNVISGGFSSVIGASPSEFNSSGVVFDETMLEVEDVGDISFSNSELVSSGISVSAENTIDVSKVDVSSSPIYCNHANEMPVECPCGPNCYCKSHSCKPRSEEVQDRKCKKCFGRGEILDPALEGIEQYPWSGDLHGVDYNIKCPNCGGKGEI